MTSQRPPRRSTVPAPPRKSRPPKKREAIEVEIDWLESPEPSAPTKRAKAPPPIPGAPLRAPPMPVKPSKPPPPPRRETMEVDVRELMDVPRVPMRELLKPARPAGKPIPREEDDAPRKSKRPPAPSKK